MSVKQKRCYVGNVRRSKNSRLPLGDYSMHQLSSAAGFFTPINNALKADVHGNQRKHIGLGKHSEVREALLDLTVLLKLLSRRPTHVREIVPEMPKFAGYHDAAAEGGGGVWFSLHKLMQPLLWRLAFPLDIKIPLSL